MVEISAEMKKQFEEQKQQCPFCKIQSGEIQAKKVYSDSLVECLLDINPWTRGHVLIVPKDHYPIVPFYPAETLNHMFRLIPKMCGALKSAFLCTGAGVFIANGGAAGQQSAHFLLHIFPRENGDALGDFFILKGSKNAIDPQQSSELKKILAHNIPAMINNHILRVKAGWYLGGKEIAEHLSWLDKENILHIDEKLIVSMADDPLVLGHLVMRPQELESFIEKADDDDAIHLFNCATLCATAVFESLRAHASNIIVKSGKSPDNPKGLLEIHIFPRYGDDGLDVLPKAGADSTSLDEVEAKIKDKMFEVRHHMENSGKKKEKVVIDLDSRKKTISEKNASEQQAEQEKTESSSTPQDEIRDAIRRFARR